jgi:hypothetical protein
MEALAQCPHQGLFERQLPLGLPCSTRKEACCDARSLGDHDACAYGGAVGYLGVFWSSAARRDPSCLNLCATSTTVAVGLPFSMGGRSRMTLDSARSVSPKNHAMSSALSKNQDRSMGKLIEQHPQAPFRCRTAIPSSRRRFVLCAPVINPDLGFLNTSTCEKNSTNLGLTKGLRKALTMHRRGDVHACRGPGVRWRQRRTLADLA